MRNNAPESVLVVQTAFIGDVLLIVPLLRAAKQFWPDANLDVMVRPPGDNLLETLPYVNEIIVYDKYGGDRGVSGFAKVLKRLHSRSYDLALLPHRSLRSGLLAFLSGIPRRVGFSRGGGRFFHTKSIPYPKQVHEIPRNLILLNPFGTVPPPEPPEIVSTEEDVERVNGKLDVASGSKLIALAPGSVWLTKRWPEESYIRLGQKLIAGNFRIVLIGGAEDKNLSARIAAALGEDCLDLTGQLTLRQSVEVLRRCEMLITNDSAPTHLGVAAGTRVLTIFGSTLPEFGFAPFGPNGRALGTDLYCRPCTDHGRQRCPEKHLRCLKDLTPERVFEEARDMMAKMSLRVSGHGSADSS